MSDKFDDAFEKAHGFTFDKFQFDNPDYEMLNVDEESYLEHLRVQASGLAYYASIAKTAERNFIDYESAYKSRYNEMYSDCSDTLSRTGKKNNVKDVESFVQTKYSAELSNMNKQLSLLRAAKDSSAAFYESWKAKGFILNSMTNLITSGLLQVKTSITEQDIDESNRRREALEKFRNRQ